MLNIEQIKDLVSRCTFEDWNLEVRMDGDRPYLQVHVLNGKDADTGERLEWTGRKWQLSHHMVPNEVVMTAFKAVMGAMEHEIRELFRYKGVPIFNPHLDPDLMVELMKSRNLIQERKNNAFAA